MDSKRFVQAAQLNDILADGPAVVQIAGHTIAIFAQGDSVYAVDNRCPHMGFPLERGTVKEGILTCHWHHARFDLESGGTFDQWADDVRSFPVEIRDDAVWVDVSLQHDPEEHQKERLRVGLERNLSLVMGKAVLFLLDGGSDPVEPFRAGLEFGCKYRWEGWGQGLTMLTCFMNLIPYLEPREKPRALFHGLSAVAQDCFGQSPRFPVDPLPGPTPELAVLKKWFRQFVEVRDDEGAERCIISAIKAGADDRQMADILFAAVTDHRYIDTGHPADFTNKAFEALDRAGWDLADTVLTSLVGGYTRASRMEESNAWRHPVDLIEILDKSFDQLPGALERGRKSRNSGRSWDGLDVLVPTLLGDSPGIIVDAMSEALSNGATVIQLASAVSYAAELRIAQFHTSNEFNDWDTALHTFTFANAIEQGLRRAPSVELLRGVFDAAMSVWLDRFLNIPAAGLPEPGKTQTKPEEILGQFDKLLDQQQQINQAGDLVAQYSYGPGKVEPLLSVLGALLLREDRDFHTIQMVEGAFNQFQRLKGSNAGIHVLVAAARYLAAHSPTVRAQGQTYEIAYRLHRGDRIFEGG